MVDTMGRAEGKRKEEEEGEGTAPGSALSSRLCGQLKAALRDGKRVDSIMATPSFSLLHTEMQKKTGNELQVFLICH